MLTDKGKAALRAAVRALRDGDGRAWSALAPLSAIAAHEADVTIDFTAEAAIGAPVVVVRPHPAVPLTLSPRRAEVARLVARGMSNKAIARRLGISPATVKDHVHAILQETGAQSRADLIARMYGPDPIAERG